MRINKQRVMTLKSQTLLIATLLPKITLDMPKRNNKSMKQGRRSPNKRKLAVRKKMNQKRQAE